MSEIYTTGSWKPHPGDEEGFVEAWKTFAGWASGWPGAGPLRLARDRRDPGRFVSFGPWASGDHVHAWKTSPEFKERMAQVQQHVAEFTPTELELVATAEDGAAESVAADTLA